MSKIPEDIKNKIEQQFPEGCESWHSRQMGAIYGYSLSLERIGELEKEIHRVKDLLAQMWYTNYGDIMNNKIIASADERWKRYKEANKL